MITGIVLVPEFRSSGVPDVRADFGIAEEHLAALSPQRVEVTDELYRLAREGNVSAKARDAVMDVKRLRAINDGLP